MYDRGLKYPTSQYFFSFSMYTRKNQHQIWEWLIHSNVCQNPHCSDFQLNPLWNQPRPQLTPKRCAGDEVVMEQPNFSENVRTYQENDMNGPYIQYS